MQCVLILISIFIMEIEIKEKPPMPQFMADEKIAEDAAEKELLARAIYGEASNQGDEGMQAVGNVILNRVNGKDWYGNTITDVILNPKQFSAFNDIEDKNYKRMMSATKENDEAYSKALEIAEGLMQGTIEDNTEGATHYYNPKGANPYWKDDPLMRSLKQIGDHWFFVEG